MPLKTHALVTVLADTLDLSNIGFRKTFVKGDTNVSLPADVAKQFADEGAVTITTPADAS